MVAAAGDGVVSMRAKPCLDFSRPVFRATMGLVLAAMPPAAAHAADRLAFVPLGNPMEAPAGYVEMCAADPALCRAFRPQALPVVPDLPRLDLAPIHLPLAAPLPAPLAAIAPLRALRPTVAALTLDLPSALSGRLELARQPTAALEPPPLLVVAAPAPAPTPLAQPAPDERALMRLVREVNAHVNQNVHQRSDAEIFGRGEVWRPSGTGRSAVGDCEDLALEKRLELLGAGFPAERLFMAVVYRPGVGLHAVLLVRTGEGDLVLDSRTQGIRPWAASGYRWLSVQSPLDPDRWYMPA